MSYFRGKTIKCRQCKCKIAKKNIFKENERNIFIKYNSNISINTSENSYLAKCGKCEKILGFMNIRNENYMLFKEKVTY